MINDLFYLLAGCIFVAIVIFGASVFVLLTEMPPGEE
jgi:uncharacterized paraquat-inducible protein A